MRNQEMDPDTIDYPMLAKYIYGTAKHYHALKSETWKPEQYKDTPWCMKQFRNSYSSGQIPKKDIDEILYSFTTFAEDDINPPKISSDTATILINGEALLLTLWDENR